MLMLKVFLFSVIVAILILASLGCQDHDVMGNNNISNLGARFGKVRSVSGKPRGKSGPHDIDPITELENILYAHMFGNKTEIHNQKPIISSEVLVKYPTGSLMRKEYFKGKKAVHAPSIDILSLSGINKLKVTQDHMQTAVDAFSIIRYGNNEDIKQMPPEYILHSAQTISMMKVTREKLTSIWSIVKGPRHPSEITPATLELYRPLFKYLSGREMAQLNLTDDKILSFIGTHEDLTRHQVGVVASTYIRQNPNWLYPYYLNMMNNLICGIPINDMRKISESTYLQLSPEVFYQIRSCEEIQKKFLLSMLSRTQILGKPFSWAASELSRVGMILTAVKGTDLASINPDAFVGLTSQVMKKMDPVNLQYLNQKQINKMSKNVYNILAKKMLKFETNMDFINNANKYSMSFLIIIPLIIVTM